MNENIKKFEYYIFIKKIKEKIYVKNLLKTNIILFQKRSALDQLLINIIFQMKNNILKEKLKRLLIKKFIYKVMNNYIDRYNSEKTNEIQKNKKINSDLLKNQKIDFNNFLLKSYILSFFEKTNICINNTKLNNIINNYEKEKRKEYLLTYFQKIKILKENPFINEKKIFMSKIFFMKIKYNKRNQTKINNSEKQLNDIKKLFIYKNNFHFFLNNHENNKEKINKINLLKQKIQKFRKNKNKSKEIQKFFKRFIKRVKIMKQTNISLKRKIFNILKNNAVMTKDLKRYLNEAEEIK